MTKPILSVLIDTYNHERYIEQAVVSAIEQDFPASDYEIVVVDDGSTDRTPEIVGKFGPRVRLLRKTNGGQASAFNAGFAELRGDVVAFLDGDDWFAKGKLTAVMNALGKEPEAAAIGHGYYKVREDTSETDVCVPPETKFLRLATPEAAREAMLCWRFLLMGALTVRRKVLEKIMPIPEVLVFSADGPISVTAMTEGVRILDQPLFHYRHHSDNLFAVDAKNAEKRRRSAEMNEAMFELLAPMLIRAGVRADVVSAFVDPPWIHYIRANLAASGGSRLKTFRTEMRSFHSEFKNPSLPYLLFKYLVVGTATLLLPPRSFYRARDWYTGKKIASVREQIAPGNRAPGDRAKDQPMPSSNK
ncbi:MAG TPA: glycosyltransferase family 2 protein [Candidatus Dormibacteraeota bacterium]|nr:glycosyltransferase family 2 protein [Candidatus Dormibacteraeota bacterium]